MASKIGKQFVSFLGITFILWYLLRRTGLGSAYTSDMFAIPQTVMGVGEGLISTGQSLKR